MKFQRLTALVLTVLGAVCLFSGCQPSRAIGKAGYRGVNVNDEVWETKEGNCITENNISFYCEQPQSEEGFALSGGLSFVFSEDLADYNRVRLTYSSDLPVRAEVRYRIASPESKLYDDYYLDAGENVEFRGLISAFLDGIKAEKLYSLTLYPLVKSEGYFRLKSLSVETVETTGQSTYYLENDRFRVGIALSWGGGIEYVADKSCPVKKLENLINRHDAGRLVQQSYYGTTGNESYAPGVYNNARWRYNPVQGGDMYDTPSRLIDVEFGDDYLYVKTQPQDWSLDNNLTKSYMENTYSLTKDYVRVDNRFTDYSGWEHGYAQQELPAFYTVSYLDRFTWYDGDKPWTGDGLSHRNDLPFWGDAANGDRCFIALSQNNTETWCAWSSSSSGFGVGLFVPEIDCFFAGRHNYNKSKNPYNDATNYVAPLDNLEIVSFDPIEYGYLITTGNIDEIRTVFADNKDALDNSSLKKHSVSIRKEK